MVEKAINEMAAATRAEPTALGVGSELECKPLLNEWPPEAGAYYRPPECPTTELGLRCWCIQQAGGGSDKVVNAQKIYDFITAPDGDPPDAG